MNINEITSVHDAKKLKTGEEKEEKAEEIGNWVHSHQSMTSFTIPSSVTRIGYHSFYNCSKLSSISMPSSITSIAKFAFRDCVSLETVSIPPALQKISDKTFYGCESLSKIIIPKENKMISIGLGAFEDCKSLQEINLPPSVTEIGPIAFKGCKSLRDINLPPSIDTINNGVFYDCKSITAILIPSHITSIGEDAFRNCTGAKSIQIPPSINEINAHSFANCSAATSIDLPPTIKTIGCYAFSYCTNMKLNFQSSSLKSIQLAAFARCKFIKSIDMGQCSVEVIEAHTFDGCLRLKSFIAPPSLRSIGGFAFRNCISLENILLPTKVRVVSDDDEAPFHNCFKHENQRKMDSNWINKLSSLRDEESNVIIDNDAWEAIVICNPVATDTMYQKTIKVCPIGGLESTNVSSTDETMTIEFVSKLFSKNVMFCDVLQKGNKISWRSIEQMISTHCTLLTMTSCDYQDEATNLYPFMLAAAASSDLEVIYKLMCVAPHTVKPF